MGTKYLPPSTHIRVRTADADFLSALAKQRDVPVTKLVEDLLVPIRRRHRDVAVSDAPEGVEEEEKRVAYG